MTPRKKYDDDIDWSKVTKEEIEHVFKRLAEIDERRKARAEKQDENKTT